MSVIQQVYLADSGCSIYIKGIIIWAYLDLTGDYKL